MSTRGKSSLRQTRAFDNQALSMIFDEFYEPLYRYIYHLIGHRATAEDLVAEVFRRLLEQINKGRSPENYLKAWLYRVAHNLSVDELRSSRHRMHEELDDHIPADETAPSRLAEDAPLIMQTQEALQQLTPKQRTVITLKYTRGLENDEIARVLKTTEGAVRALQFRGLKLIRQHLVVTGMITGEDDDFNV